MPGYCNVCGHKLKYSDNDPRQYICFYCKDDWDEDNTIIHNGKDYITFWKPTTGKLYKILPLDKKKYPNKSGYNSWKEILDIDNSYIEQRKLF